MEVARPDRRELERHPARHLPPRTATSCLAVYKPAKGERPLWDFPGGLFRREVAAYVLSETLGWGLVPETVARHEGPFGPGLGAALRPRGRHLALLHPARRAEVAPRPACGCRAFDVVANNADRKSGHVLLAEDRLWAIDNGLCFNRDDKLRTVIWDFGGRAAGRRGRSRTWRGSPTTARPPRCAELHRAGRGGGHPRPGGLAAQPRGPCPSWSTTGAGPPTPGRWSEPSSGAGSV